MGRYLAQVEPQRIDATWNGLREAMIYKICYPAMLGPFKNFLLPDGTSLLENHAWLYWPGFIVNLWVAAVLGTLVPLLLLAFMLAGRQTIPFVRIVLWSVILFAFITSGSYFYLMLQSRDPEFSPLATTAAKALPSNSVLDFNERLYASTRYKYFNYRVFAMARRFDQVESGHYQGLTFRHAMLIKYDPENK